MRFEVVITMNRSLAKKLRKRHEAQAAVIRELGCFDSVQHGFSTEYRVAKELLDARKKAGLTQREVADAMGTTQSVISRIERGANVSLETLDRYVAACGRQLEVHVV